MSDDENISPIKEYRQKAGLSLEAFGERFNPPYHKTSILRWERLGVPTDLNTILEIEKVTGIPRTKLVPAFFDLAGVPGAVGQ
ncbi:hypothetical protein ASC97_05770 [Rhizobium sp. Root1203]|uniref:helix-turn-helix domain-containing protein n=1 Tax=Rhizobium sp. Root1203 TaxID=1736427 RepID=UPI00070B730F|nr:helix-turn-helix transcriptional regulator [Rhizobium sp. Root1203]KQV27869.1 hypothetical protein ASC97_05770 [Rhizobium sp. Root1203]